MKIDVKYETAPVKEAVLTLNKEELGKLKGILALAAYGCRSRGQSFSRKYDFEAEVDIDNFRRELGKAGL